MLQLISRFDSYNIDGPFLVFSQFSFIKQFAAIKKDEASYLSLVKINFASKIFKKAANVYFTDSIDAFVKELLGVIIFEDLANNTCLCVDFYTIECNVRKLIDLIPEHRRDCLENLFNSLLRRVCAAQAELTWISAFIMVSYAIDRISLHIRWKLIKLPLTCFVNGRLLGTVLCALARNDDGALLFLQEKCSAAAFAELFAIRGIRFEKDKFQQLRSFSIADPVSV